MSDKITSQEWDKILKVLNKYSGSDEPSEKDKELVSKVEKALKRTGEKEHERTLRIIRAGVWYKKLVEALKQARNGNIAIASTHLPVSCPVASR